MNLLPIHNTLVNRHPTEYGDIVQISVSVNYTEGRFSSYSEGVILKFHFKINLEENSITVLYKDGHKTYKIKPYIIQ